MTRRKQRGRATNGILVLDKPVGLTSNAALQQVKLLFNAAKAGHTGNLDPLAHGVLPICFGEATKLSAYLLSADKVYVGTCKLGVRTTTADAEGDILETRLVEGIDTAQVNEVLGHFQGVIEQIPPMHSAIKHHGQPLYKLAHQGIEVERKPRQVQIYTIRLLRLNGNELDIYVHCSKGTYIRTLAEDIGEMLGCGAHLSELRRTVVGPFTDDQAVTFDELKNLADAGETALDSSLLSMDSALMAWPRIDLTPTTLFYVRQGQPVIVPGAPSSGWLRLYGPDSKFIGVGTVADDGRVAPKRLLLGG